MDSHQDRHLLLAGDPPKQGNGVLAVVSSRDATDPNDGSEQETYDSSDGDAFLVAPLLRVLGDRGTRRLVIGQVRVLLAAGRPPEVTIAVQAVWSEDRGWHQEKTPENLDETLIGSLARPAHEVDGDNPKLMAVVMGKAFAESSRNEVLRIRGIRYELERHAADLLAKRSDRPLRPLLSEVVELAIAIGRARDQAREILREGMWIWLWDAETYQLNRSENVRKAEPNGSAPWAAKHRAAIRHCAEMDTQLAEESSRLHSLLTSMSTFAVAQDGEQQQRFNMIAAMAAAGLGLPALILSLYGAETFLPLDSFDHAWRALVPIILATSVAIVVAFRRIPGRVEGRHYVIAAVLVLWLIGVLLFAGVLAPGS